MFALNEGDAIRGDASAATVVDYTLHGIIGTTIRQLADGQLASSEGNLYTATTDGIAVTAICLVNTDTSARTVNLYLKPKGGTSRRVVPKAISLSAGYSMYANGVEIKIVDTSGQEQTSAIALDDTPVDAELTKGITSNWAYDTAAKLDDVTHTEPARAIDATVYQNTGSKIRLVSVTVRCEVINDGGGTALAGSSYVEAYCGSSNPPTTKVALAGLASIYLYYTDMTTGDELDAYYSLFFVAAPSDYYKIASTNTVDGDAPTLMEWHEWDLL